MGRVFRGATLSAKHCQTVVRLDTEARKLESSSILDCSVDLTAPRRAAVVQSLIDVKAGNSKGFRLIQVLDMIRFEDGLPEHLASTVALCTADLPFIVQLLNVMKRGPKKRGQGQRSQARKQEEKEPETALPKDERLFSRYTMESEEGNCKVLFKLCFREGEQEAVLAATGHRKSATGNWKYSSEGLFVHATGQPWEGMPLKEFKNATARAGVHAWLTWIVQYASTEEEEGKEQDS